MRKPWSCQTIQLLVERAAERMKKGKENVLDK